MGVLPLIKAEKHILINVDHREMLMSGCEKGSGRIFALLFFCLFLIEKEKHNFKTEESLTCILRHFPLGLICFFPV